MHRCGLRVDDDKIIEATSDREFCRTVQCVLFYSLRCRLIIPGKGHFVGDRVDTHFTIPKMPETRFGIGDISRGTRACGEKQKAGCEPYRNFIFHDAVYRNYTIASRPIVIDRSSDP